MVSVILDRVSGLCSPIYQVAFLTASPNYVAQNRSAGIRFRRREQLAVIFMSPRIQGRFYAIGQQGCCGLSKHSAWHWLYRSAASSAAMIQRARGLALLPTLGP